VTCFNRVFSCTPLEVVLWGEQATSFPADQISIAGQDSLQIIIFVGTLARSYAGMFV
jgi:replication factor A1